MNLLVEFMSSNETDEIYKKLLRVYEEEGYVNPKAVLNNDINELMKRGKTKEEAIRHLHEHPEERVKPELKSKEEAGKTKLGSEFKKEAALASKREEPLRESDYYEESPHPSFVGLGILEAILGGVIATSSVSIQGITVYPYASFGIFLIFYGVTQIIIGVIDLKNHPSPWWWLVPLYFGIIGGIAAFLYIQDDDKETAKNILLFSIIWQLVLILVGFIIVLKFTHLII
jgi:hypothetical protein